MVLFWIGDLACLQVEGFSNGEGPAVFVPGCGNQIVELTKVGSRDGDCKFIGVMAETHHCLSWSRDHVHPFVQGQWALSNSCVWLAHNNKDCLNQGCNGHLHKTATDF